MRYMLVIYGDEQGTEGAEMSEWFEYDQAVKQAGVHEAGDGLQPTSTATTVRVRNGERLLTDGPFAETKEQLGGFYILNCKDLDEAISWAERIPGSRYGSVEVRPIMDYEAAGAPEGAAEQAAS
jgi:hypothetical protein